MDEGAVLPESSLELAILEVVVSCNCRQEVAKALVLTRWIGDLVPASFCSVTQVVDINIHHTWPHTE